MATGVMTQAGLSRRIATGGLSWMERSVLRRAHPRALYIEAVGWLWFGYFFWAHDWFFALVAVAVSRVVSFWSVRDVGLKEMSETVLGKIALLHLETVNLGTQAVGLLVFAYGLWEHSGAVILGGLSIVLLGHLAGWAKVDGHFADKAEG